MKQRSWLAILLSFAGPCRGKLVLSVICAIISVVGGFVPYLGVYEILRLFIHQSASGTELLRWAGVCLAGYTVKVAFYAFSTICIFYTSDAADDLLCLDLRRRRTNRKIAYIVRRQLISKTIIDEAE